MPIHFEELWTKAERLHQDYIKNETGVSIADELQLKVNLYRAISQKEGIPEEEKSELQSRTIGEILLTLTKLSLKDNLDVYKALSIAMQYRSIEHFAVKHST